MARRLYHANDVVRCQTIITHVKLNLCLPQASIAFGAYVRHSCPSSPHWQPLSFYFPFGSYRLTESFASHVYLITFSVSFFCLVNSISFPVSVLWSVFVSVFVFTSVFITHYHPLNIGADQHIYTTTMPSDALSNHFLKLDAVSINSGTILRVVSLRSFLPQNNGTGYFKDVKLYVPSLPIIWFLFPQLVKPVTLVLTKRSTCVCAHKLLIP